MTTEPQVNGPTGPDAATTVVNPADVVVAAPSKKKGRRGVKKTTGDGTAPKRLPGTAKPKRISKLDVWSGAMTPAASARLFKLSPTNQTMRLSRKVTTDLQALHQSNLRRIAELAVKYMIAEKKHTLKPHHVANAARQVYPNSAIHRPGQKLLVFKSA